MRACCFGESGIGVTCRSPSDHRKPQQDHSQCQHSHRAGAPPHAPALRGWSAPRIRASGPPGCRRRPSARDISSRPLRSAIRIVPALAPVVERSAFSQRLRHLRQRPVDSFSRSRGDQIVAVFNCDRDSPGRDPRISGTCRPRTPSAFPAIRLHRVTARVIVARYSYYPALPG